MSDRNRNGSASDRVPPHNLAAEESLLGAALVARSALEAVATLTKPGDFYKPGHPHIAAAMVTAYTDGWPSDPVTIAAELSRQGLLDQAGGAGYLITLQAGTPSTSNASRYASIVADHATLRRVLAAAGEIAEDVYGQRDEAAEAVARAQNRLSNLMPTGGGNGLSTLEIADVAGLIESGLQIEQPDFLTRADGQALLYAGKMHVFQAEPSSGKSWLALLAVLEVLNIGGAALYLDYEDTSAGIITRLLQVGADPAAVGERFAYVQQVGAFGINERADLERLLARLNPDICIIDGMAEALVRAGFNEDKASEVVTWFELVPRWIARTGAAVVILDHVAKDKEARQRWARGSGAKLAAIDGATYIVNIVRSFSRHRDGLLKILIAKDRPGGVGSIGEVAALAYVEPKADGERVIIRLEVDTGERSRHDGWKPTRLMATVSAELAAAGGVLPPNTLKGLIHSDKPRIVAEAITRLISEGYIAEARRGRDKVLRLVKPYTGAGDEPPPPDEPPPGLFEEDEDEGNVTRGPWPDRRDEEF